MFRNLMIVMGWIAAAAAGVWVHQLQNENAQLRVHLKVAQVEREKSEAENHRLYDLYEREKNQPATTAAAPSSAQAPAPTAAESAPVGAAKPWSADAEDIKAAEKRVADLEARLQQLVSDNRVVDQRSHTYRDQQDAAHEQSKAELKVSLAANTQALRDLKAQLGNVRAQPKSPARASALQEIESERVVLVNNRKLIESQMRATNSQEHATDSAIHQEVANEKSEIANERASLQRELEAARAELARLKLQRR